MRSSPVDSGRRRPCLRSHLRAEDGGLLIEILITTMLLVVVGLGVFMAFDGASATSGTDRARAVASGIAQQDQERMRTFRVTDLSNYRSTRTQDVAGVPYTVVSRADWVTDSSGTASCTSTDGRADYLKIVSTVSWPVMRKARPIVVTSMIAPPNGSFATNQGSLAVQVVNGAGNPLAGVTVNLGPPWSLSETTNELGCVLWGFLPTGTGTVTLGGGGPSNCIDRRGNRPPTMPVSVIGESTNTVTLECDVAANVTARFKTDPYLRSLSPPRFAGIQDSNALWLSAAHSSLDAPGYRNFGDWATLKPTIAATSVFPFASDYSFYSGNCASAAPDWGGGGGVPANQPPASGLGYDWKHNPGPGAGPTIDVWQPSLNVFTRTPSGTALSGARVRVTARSPGCAGAWDMGTTNSFGQLPDPGLPWGRYDVCADRNMSGTVRRVVLSNVDNNRWPGTALLDLTLTTSSTAGACP